jgi:hypothetical protein
MRRVEASETELVGKYTLARTSTINERTKSSSSTTKIRARRAETMPREVYGRRALASTPRPRM